MAPSGTGSDGQRPLSDERQVEEVGGNCGSPCVRCAPKCGGDFHRSGRYSGKWGLPSSARPTASAPIFFPLTLIRLCFSRFVFPSVALWVDGKRSQRPTSHHPTSFLVLPLPGMMPSVTSKLVNSFPRSGRPQRGRGVLIESVQFYGPPSSKLQTSGASVPLCSPNFRCEWPAQFCAIIQCNNQIRIYILYITSYILHIIYYILYIIYYILYIIYYILYIIYYILYIIYYLLSIIYYILYIIYYSLYIII